MLPGERCPQTIKRPLTSLDAYDILSIALSYQRGIKSLNATGMVLQLTYRLRRHLWGEWPLSRWFGYLLVGAGLATLIHWWPRPWPTVLLGGVFLAYIVLLAWAARRRYVHFEAIPPAETPLLNGPGSPPLRAEELVPVRASGRFTVEGKDQYYMDLEADFETVGSREHIVLARVHASRFLWLGRWPAWELGWWYIFFEPAMICEMEWGHLRFGPRSHQALRVVYAPDQKTTQTIYLTADSGTALQRVWDDLILDAPLETIHAAAQERREG